MLISKLSKRMFDSSIFVKKMWGLKKWCVTKVALCTLGDNCIENFHLVKYLVRYIVEGLVLL